MRMGPQDGHKLRIETGGRFETGIRERMALPTAAKHAAATFADVGLATLVLCAGLTGAQARSTNDEMMLLDPSERIEQVCNTRAMSELGKTNKGMRPDELVAYAYRDPVVKGWQIKASGAAVRSGNAWYHLSYDCETVHDGLDVKSFTYKLGAAIPNSEWGSHYLVGQ